MPAEDTSVDHYAALQISANAQNNEIKSSYRKLALLYHPDRNHGNEAEASRKFQAIQAAYEVLIDTAKRAKYDRVRLSTGTGAASTATRDGFTTSTSTTTSRAQATTKAPSNTAKRYTSTAGYASSTKKTDSRANDFKWASPGAYPKTAYQNTDREKPKSGDDDKKRRDREKEKDYERSSKYSSKPKTDYGRPESPHTSTPKRGKESQNPSAYAQYFRHRGRSPDPSHTSSTRATTGPSGDSDPDSYPGGRSWSASKSRYNYTPDMLNERFTTLRPSSPIPEARRSDGHRYQRYSEPSRTYYGSPAPAPGERYSRYSGHTERRRSSRKSDEYDKPHVPPSPPPDKERDQSKFKYTFKTGFPSDEDSVPNVGRRASQSKKSSSSTSRNWTRAYVESEDSDDGIKADDEKAPDDNRSSEAKIKKDEEVKSNGWGPKDPRPRSPRLTPMGPETPRRTPSPYASSPGRNAYVQMSEKKKVPPSSAAPPSVHAQAAPPPPPQPQPTQAPGVFAFQIPTTTVETPIPSDWQKPFTPSYSQPPLQPRFAQYQPPVFAAPPTFHSSLPQMTPLMRPASTQPISTAYQSFSQAAALSETELKNMVEGLAPGLSTKKSEPGLKSRRPRSKGAKPKLSTKFSEMSISGNSSPVKENASDGSKSTFGDTSSREDLKQKREKEAEDLASRPMPMDIDSPVPPQPPLNFQSPLSAKFEPTSNGYAADIPLPASPSNGFPRTSDIPIHQKPDPLSTFHNLANLHPINTAENLESLDGMAYLKHPRGFKSQTPSTLNLGGKSRDKVESRSPVEILLPQPPKPPTLPLPIRLDASNKLDNVAYQPYWDAMQMYVDLWRDYETKMVSLLQQKLDSSGVGLRDLLTGIGAAREYHAKAKEEKALREEWNCQKEKFILKIIEYYQLKNDVSHKAGQPPVQTNTSFLGNIGKSKFNRMPTFSGVQVAGEPGSGNATSETPPN